MNLQIKNAMLASMLMLSLLPRTTWGALYSVTQTNLVIVDPLNPSNTTIVGPHNLPSQVGRVDALAYNPETDTLFGIGDNPGQGDNFLLSFDRASGNATVISNLGNATSVGYFEGFEYVDALHSLVVATNQLSNPAQSTELLTINSSGVTTSLVSTSLDNDAAVYDPLHNLFYTVDPNGVGQFAEVNLTTGISTNLGAIPLPYLVEFAFQASDANIYGITPYTNELYQIHTTNGSSPLSIVSLGTVAGDEIHGLASAPLSVPEPATWNLLTAGVLSLLGYRGKHRNV